jgi:hypothetical protein
MALKIIAALAIVLCDAAVDAIDAGSGTAHVKVYDGTRPANPATAVTSQTLLIDFALPNPAFGAAGAVAGGALATANAVTSVAASATGTASWYRVIDRNGVAVWDGDVTATGGGGDMTVTSTSIVSGVDSSITSWTYTQPKGY